MPTQPPSYWHPNPSLPSYGSVFTESHQTNSTDVSLQKMTQTEHSPEGVLVREDEHFIEFSDTRNFAAEKWRTAVEAQEIRPMDWSRGRDADTYKKIGEYLRETMREAGKTAKQKSHLSSLLLVASPLNKFIDAFEKLVKPEKVEMTVIWCLLYLNISNALALPERLKNITTWIGTLRRSIEALNQCIENCSDENSARTQVTDIFDPLLSLLTALLKYQRTWTSDTAFLANLPQMREGVKQYIDEIDEVVYHFRQIAQHTRDQMDLNSKQYSFRDIPFRNDRTNPYDRAPFPVDNLPNIRTQNFFGREGVLERIDENLGRQDNEVLRTYLIYGLRGVGKTQIALEYASRYSSKFEAIFWIRCETSASLRQSFSDIAIALELSTSDHVTHFEENQIKVLEWLTKTDKTWLLIYDNAERDRVLDAYWPREAVGSVLITSRSYYNFEHSERRAGETIPVFTEVERWELFMELLGPDWRTRHLGGQNGVIERAAADKLLSALGGLALAINQAAYLVKESQITSDSSIKTVLDLFEMTSKSLPPRFFGIRNDKIRALDTIMAIALNHVSKNARSLLGTFTMLAPDSIPIDLFLPKDQSRLNGRLEFCKQDEGQNTATQMSSKMNEAIEELKRAQLIRQDGRNFVIHRVIQEAMNFKDVDDLQSIFLATTELLHEAFPLQLNGRPLVSVWSTCQKFVQHVVHITKAFAALQRGKSSYLTATTVFIQLLSNCGWYLYEVADYTQCLYMTNIACAASDDKTTLLYSHLVNILGSAYYERNQMKRSREHLLKVKELREIHLPEDHIQIATTLSNLGNVETSDGNLEDAQNLFEEAARIKESHGDEEVISLGLSFLQMGRVAALQDDLFAAISRYDRAEAAWMRHPEQSQQFMASLHYARGNLELSRPDAQQAAAQYKRCRDICYKYFAVHPLAAANFYKLALCEIYRGRKFHEKALAYLKKAYDIATVRSGGEIDGMVARIRWKQAEIMIDDPIQRQEGLRLRDALKLNLQEIAMGLELQIDPEWSEDYAFDMLVPGYFR